VVSVTPRPHFTPGKDPVPILQEARWTPGLVRTGGKSRPHRDSIPDRPARSSVAIPTELPGPQRMLYTYIYNKMRIYKYVRAHVIILHQHVSITSVTIIIIIIISVSYNKNIIIPSKYSQNHIISEKYKIGNIV